MNDVSPAAANRDPAIRVIAERRSVYAFSQAPVDESDIRLALDMAVRAPNHRLTRPWRFAVFLGAARHRLADAFAAAAAARQLDPERTRSKQLIAPAVVCAGVSPRLDRPKVVEEEEAHAVAAAIQNMMLALHARGLGSLWTTGALCDAPEVKEVLGWKGVRERVLGVIHVGRAAPTDRLPSRQLGHTEFTAWYR
ncbi:MAG: nitroreductase [Rhodospirillales bacterium]|nr:nitroreductase [Rhodospirillales bacterium]